VEVYNLHFAITVYSPLSLNVLLDNPVFILKQYVLSEDPDVNLNIFKLESKFKLVIVVSSIKLPLI
jgi:hypothetical protein